MVVEVEDEVVIDVVVNDVVVVVRSGSEGFFIGMKEWVVVVVVDAVVVVVISTAVTGASVGSSGAGIMHPAKSRAATSMWGVSLMVIEIAAAGKICRFRLCP